MKKMRKGFTLIELLIVIAIVGALSSMMAFSSSDAVDSADASKIISNLQSLKVAAMQIYMDEPKIASKTAITFGDSNVIDTDDSRTIAEVLGSYLGKKSDAFTTDGAASKYGLVGDETSWYVVYALDTKDSAGAKVKLEARAEDADLFAWSDATIPSSEADYYTVNDSNTHIALKVR